MGEQTPERAETERGGTKVAEAVLAYLTLGTLLTLLTLGTYLATPVWWQSFDGVARDGLTSQQVKEDEGVE